MPAITYIEFDGTEYHVDVAVGNSVMEGALNNMIVRRLLRVLHLSLHDRSRVVKDCR